MTGCGGSALMNIYQGMQSNYWKSVHLPYIIFLWNL